jgi:hypothetical protein
LGGPVEGPIDAAVLHRIAHTVLHREGLPWFRLDGPAHQCGKTVALCEIALRAPHLGMPYHEPGSLRLDPDYTLQWVTWEDAARSNKLRRAVYVDDRFLLEAGLGGDDQIRIWPARGLSPFGVELVTPSAREAVTIEERVTDTTRPPSVRR